MALIPFCTKLHSAGSSDKCRMHRCLGIDSSGAPNPKSPSGRAAPIFSFFLSSLEPNSLRMVILTIILVQVLCCHSITKITRNGINGAMFVTPTLLQKSINRDLLKTHLRRGRIFNRGGHFLLTEAIIETILTKMVVLTQTTRFIY